MGSKGYKPKGKMVLNIWISEDEHVFLARQAKRKAVTVTTLMRNLIKEKMPAEEW